MYKNKQERKGFVFVLSYKGICMCCMCFIVQNMFKHVASKNGPLVSILQSYSRIFIVKHID